MVRATQQNPIKVDVNFPALISSKDRAKLVLDLLKSLLHQRGQIPLQYAAIEKDVKLAKSNELAQEQEEENGSQTPKGSTISREQARAAKELARKEIKRKRYLTSANKFLESTNATLSRLEKELLCNDSICEVSFLFGATILSPREAFKVVLPALPTSTTKTNSDGSTSSTGVYLLRAILGNEHFQKLISRRLPVSNLHVGLTCHHWPSTDVGGLKALETLNLTASCRKVSFILPQPEDIFGERRSGRKEENWPADASMFGDETNAGSRLEKRLVFTEEKKHEVPMSQRREGEGDGEGEEYRIEGVRGAERTEPDSHMSSCVGVDRGEGRGGVIENGACEAKHALSFSEGVPVGMKYRLDLNVIDEEEAYHRSDDAVIKANHGSSEVMMEMCTPAPCRQRLPFPSCRTSNFETPVVSNIMEFATPALKRTAPGDGLPSHFTPASASYTRRVSNHSTNLFTPSGPTRYSSGSSRQEQLMDLCTPAQPKAVHREHVLDQNQPLVDMELATPAPSSKLYLPKELFETSSDIARMSLDTPKKKKKWVLFQDQVVFPEAGGGDHEVVIPERWEEDHLQEMVTLESAEMKSIQIDEEYGHVTSRSNVFFVIPNPIRGFKY